MSILKKLIGTKNRQENKTGENIAPKPKCSPEREFGDPQKHNYRAINAEKHESGRLLITYECADCGDTYKYFTPFIKNFAPENYETAAIDCYEAEKYAMAVEFAQKAFDLECNKVSMATIMLIVSNMDGDLDKILDACEKYYRVFYTYDDVSRHLFQVKKILEDAVNYMVENKKCYFSYTWGSGATQNLITLSYLDVINLLAKWRYLASCSMDGIDNGFSQSQIENFIRQLSKLKG